MIGATTSHHRSGVWLGREKRGEVVDIPVLALVVERKRIKKFIHEIS
jgi:hypothetical protein